MALKQLAERMDGLSVLADAGELSDSSPGGGDGGGSAAAAAAAAARRRRLPSTTHTLGTSLQTGLNLGGGSVENASFPRFQLDSVRRHISEDRDRFRPIRLGSDAQRADHVCAAEEAFFNSSGSNSAAAATAFVPERHDWDRTSVDEWDVAVSPNRSYPVCGKSLSTSQAESSPKSDRSSNEYSFSQLKQHIYQMGFCKGAHSDVSVHAFDSVYRLHRMILSRAPYFASLLSGDWKEGQEILQLNLAFDDPAITKESFESTLARLYGGNDTIKDEQAWGVLATAAFLDLNELVEEMLSFLLSTLSRCNLAERVKLAHGQFYGTANVRLNESTFNFLCRDGFDLAYHIWDELPVSLVARAAANDYFYVPNEYMRYVFLRSMIIRRQERGVLYPDDEAEDLEPLWDAIRNHVYYMHMDFECLEKISEDRDVFGDTIIPVEGLATAQWEQLLLRSKILKFKPAYMALNCTTKNATAYPIPRVDTTIISPDRAENVAITERSESIEYSIFPPFRFSVCFNNVNSMPINKRVYSQTTRYAGSLWNVYLQKVNKGNRYQLGVYLHRASTMNSAFRTDSNYPSHIVLLDEPNFYEFDPEIDQKEFESVDNMTSQQNDSDIHDDSSTKRSSTGHPSRRVVQTVPQYYDQRSRIEAYFKIGRISRRDIHDREPNNVLEGDTYLTEFTSTPDIFNFNQSWGWKTTQVTDCFFDNEDQVRLMIILGVV